ncbi:MAG TPA: FtsX-like permease family protein [Steroidobacteraceae bacterium]|nr:FtsX-like permease family protein [Steroidobacteraceae bacterium]
MEIRPILSALLRNRAGAILVALQIAITLAIVVNAIYLTQQRVSQISRVTGLDEQNIFSFSVQGFEKDFDFHAMVRDDMALLRRMPGLLDATPSNHVPLSGGGSSTGYYSLPEKKGNQSPANYYRVDEHGVSTLGVKLAAGTTFDPTMIEYKDTEEQGQPPVAIVSKAFGEALFPGEKILVGKDFYDDQSKPVRIIGVIEHMHGAWVGWDKLDRIVLIPRVIGPNIRYIVRTEPGQIDRMMTEVDSALRKRDPNRVIGKMRKMSDQKDNSYSGDMLMAITLTTVTGLVLVFSSLGIFGLATFNVNNRTRQIGTRRAVGARRIDIVRYFMTENWLVTTLGVVVGCILALAAGYWLSTQYQMARLDLYYLVGGVLGLWAVGQLAAWQPSLKAAKVSPAMATRNI